jgi:hypothetical protein
MIYDADTANSVQHDASMLDLRVSTVVPMKRHVFRGRTQYRLVNNYQRLREVCCPHLQVPSKRR